MQKDLSESFRVTELGPLPEEWRVVRLGEVVSLRKGTINPSEVPLTRYIGLEHIDSGNIFIHCFGIASDMRSAKAKFQKDDILYGKLRPYLDKAALAEWDGVCSTDILVLVSKDGISNIFVAYLLHSPFVLNHAVATTTGVNHPRTSWKALSQAVIPLPPLPEQRAIAHVLRTVQETREATEGVVAALQELKKSLMRHLFTYGPVPVGTRHAVSLQETEIGPIPAHWQVVRLGEVVCDMKQGRVLPTSKIKPIGKYPVYGANGIIGFYGEAFVPKNTVLLTCRGSTCGTVNYTSQEAFVTNNAMILFNDERKTHPRYLYYTLIAHPTTNLKTGSGQPQITKGRLLDFSIPLPPLPEQREIARILQAVDTRIEAEEKKKTALEALFKSLLHHLMTAKIRLPKEFVAQFDEKNIKEVS